ncbi:MAG: glycosyltransferase family 2 protein [Thermoplasmata archaeon]|nr:glycosyltransferase family 2 protein [Thermoplasmata archaeon]
MSIASFTSTASQWGLPLGGLLVGVALGALVFLTIELLRGKPRHFRAGNVPVRVAHPPPWMEDEPEGPPQEGRAAPIRVFFAGGERVLWMVGAGTHPSLPLPRARRFVVVLAGVFLAMSVLLLATYPIVFGYYDDLVGAVGTLLYWPLPWPGVYAVGTSVAVVPDYVFPMYLSGMVAFSVASGLWTRGAGTEGRRRLWAAAILMAYIGTELLLDALLFTIPGKGFRDLGLLVRSLNGGLFLALLTLCALHLPPPQELPFRFPRERGAIAVFFAVGILSLASAVLLLVAVRFWLESVSIGLSLTTLLLIPTVSLEIFGLLSRPLYFRGLRKHPVPSVSEYHPTVSILIPAYNESGWIRSTIRSADLAASSYPGAVQIIVGNDGSTDDTLRLAREAIAELRYARGVVVDLPHGGKSSALNSALALATGEIVLRLDGDTEISSTSGFGPMIPHFADPKVGAVQGGVHPRQRAGWTRKLRALEIAWNHYLLRPGGMATRSAEVVDGLFSAFRRKDLLEVGGWVPWNGEDTEISIRLQRLGFQTRIEARAVAFEDVPGDYDSLRRQRVRWARGILMANGQHYPALIGPVPEFAGLGVLIWFLMYVHSGMRSLIYVYLAALALILGVPSLAGTLVLLMFVLAIRVLPLSFFLIRMGRTDVLPWVPFYPIGSLIKQSFRFEAYGTLGPSAVAEYA